jgi:hypothetical protein
MYQLESGGSEDVSKFRIFDLKKDVLKKRER